MANYDQSQTRKSMLERLASTGTERDLELEKFEKKYSRFIEWVGGEHKLQECDYDELITNVLHAIWEHKVVEGYKPNFSFRTFLRTVVANKANDIIKKYSQINEDVCPQNISIDQDDEFSWDDIDNNDFTPDKISIKNIDFLYYKNLMWIALTEMKEQIELKTYQIFEQATIFNKESQQVASDNDVTVGYVNKVKRDCLARLREILKENECPGDNLSKNLTNELIPLLVFKKNLSDL